MQITRRLNEPLPIVMKLLFRPVTVTALNIVPQLRLVVAQRSYATHRDLKGDLPATRRKAVTPFNDNGFVPWNQLSAMEKASRATQQTFNFGLVIVGVVLTGGVGYFLYQDVFSPDSKTAYFNRVVDRIKKDPACLAVLGDPKHITAHGEETGNKWRRARPIASSMEPDAQGNDHLVMHFYVEGPLNNGLVNVHLVKRAGHHEFEYRYLFLDVKGHNRIYLENADAKTPSGSPKKLKLFGINLN
ncbi:import inner membrane translocase subunit tim-21, mitochondrial [Xylaria sp. CBS 124048]|nr:import inner membrane translocase subunit tim-21, mitochondrial [Xylaria sp. CBS 124048]